MKPILCQGCGYQLSDINEACPHCLPNFYTKHRGSEKWTCHECKDGNCASCVGVPCHCECPTLSTMSEDLEGYRNELEQAQRERDEARAEAQRLRGLLYTAAERLKAIIGENAKDVADCDIVRAMGISARDGLVELNLDGDIIPEAPTQKFDEFNLRECHACGGCGLVELNETSDQREAHRQECVDACFRIAGDVSEAGLSEVTVGALEDAVSAAKKLEALNQ